MLEVFSYLESWLATTHSGGESQYLNVHYSLLPLLRLGRIKLITCLSSEKFEKIGEGGRLFFFILYFFWINFRVFFYTFSTFLLYFC